VQNHIQQGTVSFHSSVVFDEAQLTETVHKEAHSRPRSSYYSCECLLTHLWNHFMRLAFFAEVGQQQKHSRQPLLAGIEQMV
jgi:hypothetical protein